MPAGGPPWRYPPRAVATALAVQESLSFTEMRDLLQTTDGNLSVQARKLEDAGYISCSKRFEDRKPKSIYRLSAGGRAALEEYLETLSEFLPDINRVRNARAALPLRPVPSHS